MVLTWRLAEEGPMRGCVRISSVSWRVSVEPTRKELEKFDMLKYVKLWGCSATQTIFCYGTWRVSLRILLDSTQDYIG